jgi:hypothetical protein
MPAIVHNELHVPGHVGAEKLRATSASIMVELNEATTKRHQAGDDRRGTKPTANDANRQVNK